MLSQQKPQARRFWIALVMTAMFAAPSTRAFAQDREPSNFLVDVGKRVLLDPTTYAPAAVAYYATKRDWDTSQPFFQAGANEMNPRFTVSGLPNDRPIGYEAGNRRIALDALVNLQISAVSNFAGNVVERMLVEKYPEHRKAIRAVGWIQRIGVASFLSYQLSSQHFEQARLNEQLARQWGFTK
jgi:hypothetical protein